MMIKDARCHIYTLIYELRVSVFSLSHRHLYFPRFPGNKHQTNAPHASGLFNPYPVMKVFVAAGLAGMESEFVWSSCKR